MKRYRRLRALAALLAAGLMLLSAGAFAAEGVTVEISVMARGADCTALFRDLQDEGKEPVQLALFAGETATLTLTFDKPGKYRYTLSLMDEDGGGYTYDKTVYQIYVQVYEKDGQLETYIQVQDNPSEKKDELSLEFVNRYTGGGYIPPTPHIKPCYVDPPVEKRVEGDPVAHNVSFLFRMEAQDPSYPMPEGSRDGQKVMIITGPGSEEFGVITFERAGTYFYDIHEINTGENGYTYDESVYTFRYDVVLKGNQLTVTRTILRDGVVVDDVNGAVFTNLYKAPPVTPDPVTPDPVTPDPVTPDPVTPDPVTPDPVTPDPVKPDPVKPDTPRTGDESSLALWTNLAFLSLAGVALLTVFFIVFRRKERKEEAETELKP